MPLFLCIRLVGYLDTYLRCIVYYVLKLSILSPEGRYRKLAGISWTDILSIYFLYYILGLFYCA